MIEISNLTKVYPAASRDEEPVTALDNISLTVDHGNVMGIIGPSGAGKSTLGRCLTLLTKPTSGTITVDGIVMTSLHGAKLREARRRIGVIFQSFNLLDSRSALGNVELPLQLSGVAKEERRDKAMEMLERVGLADKAKVHPAHLSGGQQQRVAIARAVVSRPSVLISDEATSALDPATTDSIIKLIRDLTDEYSLTTILISHQMEVITKVADQVSEIRAGKIVTKGGLA
ncbi:methionine ABC transporter ATP-binding protein [Propionimicrobium lymphophilum]|uniref:methionine ABC transporter ATP-binding protein n=1 Tax=Propionimicrobium lymphophilum TaxID=33012 RepID=UPI00041A1D98|nr:ATP-binding cassette domain-containing protein [Propionimicrobium lymphophilum]